MKRLNLIKFFLVKHNTMSSLFLSAVSEGIRDALTEMGYKTENQPEKEKEEKNKQNFALRVGQIQGAIEPEGGSRDADQECLEVLQTKQGMNIFNKR
jgi:hypothetical protein